MNHEGYRDETADRAVGKVKAMSRKEPDQAAVRRNRLTIDAFRAVAEASGMTIMGRIRLRDNESGWVFR